MRFFRAIWVQLSAADFLLFAEETRAVHRFDMPYRP